VKLVVLTNASLLHRPRVAAALEQLDAHRGELWVKLDAGTQAYFDRVDRSRVSLEQIVSNIAEAGRGRPIVVQSMFMRMHGEATPLTEFDAYCDQLGRMIDAGCRVKLVQLYTVARQPAESYVAPLTSEELDALAARLRDRLPDVHCEVYDGVGGTSR
jgi:wyosine [tRNA(Phe)-imidazoG37] synthetase (radical SAM superfamily)